MIGLPGALPQAANDCCAVGAKHIPLDKLSTRSSLRQPGVLD